MNFPNILALDFDGVICNGLPEYFATTKKTYLEIWESDSIENLDKFASSFYQLRPVIEIGWEMPILLRALRLEINEIEILKNWALVAKTIIDNENLNPQEISSKLDCNRDNWINHDLDSWLELHQFYPGILSILKHINNLSIELYIITTKEGRFAKKLLEQQGIKLPEENIIGKEYQRPKYQTLKLLLQASKSPKDTIIWFVEDRLKTLEVVQQQLELSTIKLFLADWGYNTEIERVAARNNPKIEVLSLKQFQQKFVN
jgi:phosphoglycolate phosphatase-like HAD superfamily hydrolase